ncbi:HicB family protein (plasmid) [Sphingomonas changnyeongensis]|uniref:HicB family protein n=1 Tax=Sphingomonas changnyeongensis TaxID=2698679 RepID=A0A7Z2NYB7_9SPHN|nr:type II toxin-antitoxin system HicB family antitoxin [Sphingomonas changnyeongensis]QHL92058.1 HicB family protein [Sphingomonas changnyeongensis]
MAVVFYPAIIERGAQGFGVTFPDLPGCVSAGGTVQEAALNAEDALAGHLMVMSQSGEAIPGPSMLDGLQSDVEVQEVARILVRADRPGRAVRLNITMDEGLVAAIDRVTSNRSGFLADAARAALSGRR